MAQTRQSSAAKIIRLLCEVSFAHTENLKEKFDEIEAMVVADPEVLYEYVSINCNDMELVHSPVTMSFSSLDYYFQDLFYVHAFRSNTVAQYDTQVLSCGLDINLEGQLPEYDQFAADYQEMQENGNDEADISNAAILQLGSAQYNYPRCIWDDIVQNRAFAQPAFHYTVNGKNVMDLQGEERLGTHYYVLIKQDWELNAIAETTNQLPPTLASITLQRDLLLHYMQLREDSRRKSVKDAKTRQTVRENSEKFKSTDNDKENSSPTFRN